MERVVRQYIDPYIAVGTFGVCGNGISAYAAKRMVLPGTASKGDSGLKEKKPSANFSVVSFPGGNTTILRGMLARMIPGSIGGDGSVAAMAAAPIDFSKLDREGAPLRFRVSSTVIDVRHAGDPAIVDHVIVTYVRDGKVRKVRAKSVIMATGGWVNRRVVTDLPAALRRRVPRLSLRSRSDCERRADELAMLSTSSASPARAGSKGSAGTPACGGTSCSAARSRSLPTIRWC